MKKAEKKIQILQLKELKHPEWEEKMRRSVELAREKENGEEYAEAQETLMNLILSLGGIREDVFRYLLIPHFKSTEAVMAIGRLLCYAAPVEWIELSVQVLERVSGTMYVNEITESYQAGLPVEQVESFLEESETIFEMCQRRIHFTNRRLGDKMTGSGEKKLGDKMTGSEQEKLVARVTGSEQPELAARMTENGNAIEGGGMAYGNLAQIITDAVMAAMQKSGQMIITDPKTELADKMTGSREEKLADRVTGSEEKPADRMTGSREEKLADKMIGRGEEKLTDKMTGSEEKPVEKETGQEDVESFTPEEIQDFPDGEELQDNRILVKELKEAEEQAGKRISFFQILLSRHMKKAFAKLDAEAQVSKIFEIMVEKKYGKEKILPIRRLMNGGMSNEFIFSLLEKDFSEEELKELCETLLAEDIVSTGSKKETSQNQLSEEDEEEFTEGWEEE